MSSYPYSLLPPDSDNIRLLRLLPNEDEAAPLHCELCNYSLQKPGPRTHLYEALSYVWGNQCETLPIYVDKKRFLVTVNLHAALSRLRDRSFERIIWVDAVCINQENKQEKEQQIQFMAEIYAQANRVVVWLGEAADNSDQALEVIRVSGGMEPTSSSNNKMIQQAIIALLDRPWFRRIWVLQEVAAARNILIHSYEACPELHSLIPSVTYLIKGAIFRPKYATIPGQASLNIRSLGELIDMYHTREATERHDKVYALLGMSSDDPTVASLSPNYTVPWEQLFERLIKFLLCEEIFVETQYDKEMAVIKSKGCILGQVSSVKSDDTENVNIIFTSKNTAWHSGSKIEWTLQASAKSIREGDIVCLLQGASKPTIIRQCKDHFAVVAIAATPLKESGSFGLSELPKSIAHFPRDFLLVWDWEKPLGESQEEGYEALAKSVQTAEFGDHSHKATRTWNVALILGDLEEYEMAEGRLREAIEGCEMAIEEEHPHKLKSKYSLTPLSWAAGNGYEARVKLLLEKDSIDPDLRDSQFGQTPLSKVGVDLKDKTSRTPLSWATGNGHEAVVKLLLETGKVEVDSKDNQGRTPLSWATGKGHEAVVKLLLETSKVEVDSKDKTGRTPLSWAARNGHEAVVKLLLETSKVEVDSKDD
ncbi:related to heterokaryon incompatibility protein [Phialocephala subalpina]|uniref:Related to heterokaryon incompatibility protein n=1 Tax=Phialocephala subalpina TaxID=576137 RepID=A0A1L7WHA2_9HELO|nr:related to heterokaryon incompatibility protein [Phialocephala subalpina]